MPDYKAFIAKQGDEHPKYDHNITKYLHDFLIILISTTVVMILARHYDFLEMLISFVHQHENWELDEFIAVSIFWSFSLTIFSIRRSLELRKSKDILIEANDDLLAAMAEIKNLKGILPICASCKNIRDDSGYWHQVETYIKDHSSAEFSHGICPDCAKKLYPDIEMPKPGE